MTHIKNSGVVLRSTGSWYTVLTTSGEKLECRLKGKFRISGIRSTNPVAVGDRVDIMSDKDTDTPVIYAIHPRNNYIVRKATRLSKQSHIIAANIDQALLVVTMAYPRTSTGFIDRFLVTTEAYHIPAILVFNKIDLYTNALKELHDEVIGIYQNIGYQCLEISVKDQINIDQVEFLMRDKVSLFSGHSGVGKSALANIIDPNLNLRTGIISEAHAKGKHTTTFAEMHVLKNNGFLVDTPGIKEFGLVDFDKKEVAERFPEMRQRMHDCRFNNCTHVNEPGCAVKEAVENGEIHMSRYYNYMSILNDDYWDDQKY